jgi:hypothetical protein
MTLSAGAVSRIPQLEEKPTKALFSAGDLGDFSHGWRAFPDFFTPHNI